MRRAHTAGPLGDRRATARRRKAGTRPGLDRGARRVTRAWVSRAPRWVETRAGPRSLPRRRRAMTRHRRKDWRRRSSWPPRRRGPRPVARAGQTRRRVRPVRRWAPLRGPRAHRHGGINGSPPRCRAWEIDAGRAPHGSRRGTASARGGGRPRRRAAQSGTALIARMRRERGIARSQPRMSTVLVPGQVESRSRTGLLSLSTRTPLAFRGSPMDSVRYSADALAESGRHAAGRHARLIG